MIKHVCMEVKLGYKITYFCLSMLLLSTILKCKLEDFTSIFRQKLKLQSCSFVGLLGTLQISAREMQQNLRYKHFMKTAQNCRHFRVSQK